MKGEIMFGDKLNLMSILKNAKKIEEMMQHAKDQLAAIEVSTEVGAGMVKVSMNAQHVLQSLQISDEALAEPKAVLEELILAAMNDANRKVNQIVQEKMTSPSGMLAEMGMQEFEKEKV